MDLFGWAKQILKERETEPFNTSRICDCRYLDGFIRTHGIHSLFIRKRKFARKLVSRRAHRVLSFVSDYYRIAGKKRTIDELGISRLIVCRRIASDKRIGVCVLLVNPAPSMDDLCECRIRH